VLPAQWLDLFREGKFHHVPVMIGHTKQEARLFAAIHENNLGRQLTLEDVEKLAGEFFPDHFVIQISREYGLQTINVSGVLAGICTDAAFVSGLEKCRAAPARETTVYSYQTFDPGAPESHVHANFSAIGAGHDSDLPALFQWTTFPASRRG
jgi:para-nitrobenzyl esterase